MVTESAASFARTKLKSVSLNSRLGWITDCLVQPSGVNVRDMGPYVVVSTPEYQDYWFGNYIYLKEPPRPADLRSWIRTWEKEFALLPGANTIFLQWECAKDCTPESLPTRDVASRPMSLTSTAVMVLDSLRAPPTESPVFASAIRTTSQHNERLAIARAELEFRDIARLKFLEWRDRAYRDQVDAGRGTWWGAFHLQELWGYAGLFGENELARFQEITTARPVRRRGVCTHLIYQVSAEHLRKHPESCLVVAAESGSDAESIYLRVGAREVSRQWNLMSPPI